MQNYVSCQYSAESKADPDCVEPDAYMIFGALYKKKNTKLGTQINIYS
jgi:hypothetical protein